jgi:hypothetical protein
MCSPNGSASPAIIRRVEEGIATARWGVTVALKYGFNERTFSELYANQFDGNAGSD